jgi:hypothetical protein
MIGQDYEPTCILARVIYHILEFLFMNNLNNLFQSTQKLFLNLETVL